MDPNQQAPQSPEGTTDPTSEATPTPAPITTATTPQEVTPVPAPTAAPVAQPQQYAQPVVQVGGSKALAITSLVLGIVSILICLVWFLAIPLAITAVVLGIVALVKRRGGKGMSITGIVTGGFTVVVIGPLIIVTLISYNAITQRALEAESQSQQRQSQLFN